MDSYCGNSINWLKSRKFHPSSDHCGIYGIFTCTSTHNWWWFNLFHMAHCRDTLQGHLAEFIHVPHMEYWCDSWAKHWTWCSIYPLVFPNIAIENMVMFAIFNSYVRKNQRLPAAQKFGCTQCWIPWLIRVSHRLTQLSVVTVFYPSPQY